MRDAPCLLSSPLLSFGYLFGSNFASCLLRAYRLVHVYGTCYKYVLVYTGGRLIA